MFALSDKQIYLLLWYVYYGQRFSMSGDIVNQYQSEIDGLCDLELVSIQKNQHIPTPYPVYDITQKGMRIAMQVRLDTPIFAMRIWHSFCL